MLELIKISLVSQPELWAHDQDKGMKRCRPNMQLGNHTHTSRSARKCEGMSRHTPKWTLTLGIRVPMDF